MRRHYSSTLKQPAPTADHLRNWGDTVGILRAAIGWGGSMTCSRSRSHRFVLAQWICGDGRWSFGAITVAAATAILLLVATGAIPALAEGGAGGAALPGPASLDLAARAAPASPVTPVARAAPPAAPAAAAAAAGAAREVLAARAGVPVVQAAPR
jgi:hypothetical protein